MSACKDCFNGGQEGGFRRVNKTSIGGAHEMGHHFSQDMVDKISARQIQQEMGQGLQIGG
jgi:hypothetical protein